MRWHRKPKEPPWAKWIPPAELSDVAIVAVLRVIDAWEDAGINPSYHYRGKADLAIEWPTLYHTLNDLVEVIDKEAARKRIAELADQFLDS